MHWIRFCFILQGPVYAILCPTTLEEGFQYCVVDPHRLSFLHMYTLSRVLFLTLSTGLRHPSLSGWRKVSGKGELQCVVGPHHPPPELCIRAFDSVLFQTPRIRLRHPMWLDEEFRKQRVAVGCGIHQLSCSRSHTLGHELFQTPRIGLRCPSSNRFEGRVPKREGCSVLWVLGG